VSASLDVFHDQHTPLVVGELRKRLPYRVVDVVAWCACSCGNPWHFTPVAIARRPRLTNANSPGNGASPRQRVANARRYFVSLRHLLDDVRAIDGAKSRKAGHDGQKFGSMLDDWIHSHIRVPRHASASGWG
jgi:hypothetical protein